MVMAVVLSMLISLDGKVEIGSDYHFDFYFY